MRQYWLDLFSVETWTEFVEAGSDVSGFSLRRWPTVQRFARGDYLLCYLTQESRWVAVLEVVGDPYLDHDTKIWNSAQYPARVPVSVVVALEPETAIPVYDTRSYLTVFQGLKNPNKWMGPFRSSPTLWKPVDGEAILQLLEEAASAPVRRPLRKSYASLAPALVDSDGNTLTLPLEEGSDGERPPEASVHTEMQYLLLKLGADLGYDVHVARNDQSRTWNGIRLGDLPRRRDQLPQQFDPLTNRTIELIDVLWLDDAAVVGAFEIESTTSVYSGLLRMSDLLAMQPNISIPLFIVAPEDRRPKVVAEVNRPTFKRRKPPLVDVCRYIAFETLRDQLAEIGDNVTFLRPEWLQKVSESCAVDEGDA